MVNTNNHRFTVTGGLGRDPRISAICYTPNGVNVIATKVIPLGVTRSSFRTLVRFTGSRSVT